MGAITNSIPEWLAGALQREFALSTFVETGTGQGTSVLWAERNFATCISIEIDPSLYCQFQERYPHNSIEAWYGDSGIDLKFAVQELYVPALFWLDGHTDDHCPVIEELAAINASSLDHIIMIDDARLFGTMAAWPTREQVVGAAEASGRRIVFDVDDVLIAVPIAFAGRIGKIIERR